MARHYAQTRVTVADSAQVAVTAPSARAIREGMTEEAVLLNPALTATEATLYGFTISDSTTRSST